jgi:hypothetical protein
MSQAELKKALDATHELEITVIGRKSGREISLPVWFIRENNKIYLLPVKGSDTNWYKNVLKKPTMQISAGGIKVPVEAKPITDVAKVKEIADKFRAKYGAGEVKKYYSKFDVGMEIDLTE